MGNEMLFRDEDFAKSLLTTILTADGLILTLSWGLFDWDMPSAVKNILLPHLKWGSSFLAASLVSGILCFQFMVSLSQSQEYKNDSIMKKTHVGTPFLVCWIFFLIGIVIFVIGIWRL
jgi:hypothetical protein